MLSPSDPNEAMNQTSTIMNISGIWSFLIDFIETKTNRINLNLFSGSHQFCPRPWTRFKSYCYLVSSLKKTWHEAQAFCKAKKGELVKINSAEENEFVLALARKKAPTVNQVWIGLKYNSNLHLKKFLWSDLSVPVYNNWGPHQPSGKGKEPCGHMWTNGHEGVVGYWNDISCGVHSIVPNGIVCKRLP